MKGILEQQKQGTWDSAAQLDASKRASELGVSDKAFFGGLQKAGVGIQDAAAAPPKSELPLSGASVGYEEARQGAVEEAARTPQDKAFDAQMAAAKVMQARQYGSGLEANAAMQNPDYELGSGSALRQGPRQIGTASGAMRREARKLRKEGYMGAAQKMALDASQVGLAEGSAITSEAQRGRMSGQRIEAAEAAYNTGKAMRDFTDAYKKRKTSGIGSGMEKPEIKQMPYRLS